MFVDAIQRAKASIFPIIATLTKNGRYAGSQVAGTGFFIDDIGHFVTALHVVSGDPNVVKYGSLGNIPNATFKNAQPEAIKEVGRNPELDLYVGKLEINLQAPLRLASHNPPLGTSIVIGGYPFPNIQKKPNGSLEFYTVRQYWQSTMIMDYLHMGNFNPILRYNGFLVDKRTIPGMSGGPVLNVAGEIVGLCTAQITRAAKDRVPNINGVCLDAKSLAAGVQHILDEHAKN